MRRNGHVLVSVSAILLGVLTLLVVVQLKSNDVGGLPKETKSDRTDAANSPIDSNSNSAKPDADVTVSTSAHTPAPVGAMAQLSKQFEVEKNCFDGMRASEIAKHMIEFCATPEASQSPRAVDECKRVQSMFPSGVSRASSLAPTECASTPAEINERYFSATYAAAKAGDADAQLCMIDRDPGRFALIDQRMSPEERQQLFDSSMQWVQQAVQRGDTRIVSYVAMNTSADYLVPAFPGLENSRNDPRIVEYSLLRLARMNATGPYARLIDGRIRGLMGDSLNTVEGGGGDPAVVVSPEDAKAADAWAQETFERYFANAPAQAAVPEICTFPQAETLSGS